MTFYIWDQNNSGGSFDVDENLAHRVIIEACTYAEAEEKALAFGVYYDGVDDGIDCDCCGDRWYSGEEVTQERMDCYGANTVEEYAQAIANKYGWTSPDAYIHYRDKPKVSVFIERSGK